ncbi:MAG: hypothetical protein ACR2KT_13950 [Methylocella sp.]|nr:MAG: hypothetical protein DLM68_01105 [Hyphomicrobiales bacterium]
MLLIASCPSIAQAGVIALPYIRCGLWEHRDPPIYPWVQVLVPKMGLLAGRKSDLRMLRQAFVEPCGAARLETENRR